MELHPEESLLAQRSELCLVGMNLIRCILNEFAGDSGAKAMLLWDVVVALRA